MVAYADYLIVISLPESVVKEINRYKRASVNVIGHFEGTHSSAQIIITHQVRCKPYMVQPVIEQMAGRLSTMPPVELTINGFGFFNSSKTTNTIYALIEQNICIDNWFKLLINQLGIRIKNFTPRIVIAKNIPVTSFHNLWQNFEKQHWAETFTVNSLTILHRDTYVDYCEWRCHRELFFANRLKQMF
jgi:hypothetical protein